MSMTASGRCWQLASASPELITHADQLAVIMPLTSGYAVRKCFSGGMRRAFVSV
jgi:hypothetical protein